MRTLILLGLVVGGLVVAGAIHISQSNGTIEVSIDKQRVQNVAGAVAHDTVPRLAPGASMTGRSGAHARDGPI